MAILKRGSSGPDVEDLQRQLGRLGYDTGPVDGRFGPATRAAVIDFQKRRGLSADGIVGPATSKALREAIAEFTKEPKPPVREDQLVVNRSLRLADSRYYNTAHPKDLIVLHHTAGGSARSTFNWWQQSPSHIATAFIIERDGEIFEFFDPKHWAYHLGLKGTRGSVDKRSIGIEIASEGGLKESNGKLYKFDRVSASHEFKGDAYDHGSNWRGYRHFAAYTEGQVKSAILLTRHLLDEFGIERVTPKDHNNFSEGHKAFRGVIGHHHVRSDKSDLHPGFDWKRLISECSLRKV